MKQNLKLNSGYDMPIIGLGTYKSEPNKVGTAVKYALTQSGYNHVDCAAVYQNEKEVGEAFHEVFSHRSRESVFITSKLWNTNHAREDVGVACRQTLQDLGLEYLDLYLIHWGFAFQHGNDVQPMDKDGKLLTAKISIRETWEAMQELVTSGLVKSIGVANFTCPMLADLLTYAKIPPAVNQIELHPYLPQSDLVKYCQDQFIVVTAYSPLGRQGVTRYSPPRLFDENNIQGLAKKYSKTVAQIILNWGVSRDTIVIPKSENPERIKENMDIFDFVLTKDEHDALTALNCNRRFIDVKEGWGIPYFE
jgi:diketogulonate reductase-like aldo/keto reductase